MGMPAGVWLVQYLYAFLAEASRLPEAVAALSHMAGSFRVEPRWVTAQLGAVGNFVELNARTNEYVMGQNRTVGERRSGGMADLHEGQVNVIGNRVDLLDPNTGAVWKVEQCSDFYRINDLEDIVGTCSEIQFNRALYPDPRRDAHPAKQSFHCAGVREAACPPHLCSESAEAQALSLRARRSGPPAPRGARA